MAWGANEKRRKSAEASTESALHTIRPRIENRLCSGFKLAMSPATRTELEMTSLPLLPGIPGFTVILCARCRVGAVLRQQRASKRNEVHQD